MRRVLARQHWAASAQVAAVTGGTPVPSAPMSSIAANGWQADYASTPSVHAPVPFTVSRQGFDATGAAATFPDSNAVLTRVRQPYPNHASMSALTVALDYPVLAADSVSGATNNSTLVSPTSIVNWAMLSQQLVGNSLTLEVTGNHWAARNKKPFAAAVFTVTDGTTTLTATASALSVSGHPFDRYAVQVYSVTIDITSLNTGLITANCKVYPWIGVTASIADSSTSTERRGFSPRYFYKDAARLAIPPLAYVASTGNDATGVASTTAATAKATPFLTVQGAMNGLVAATGVTGGYVDGCRIRIVDAVNHGASAASARAQRCAAVIIERDPAVAKSAAVLTITATWRMRLGVGTLLGANTEGAVMFRDMTVVRAGAFTLQGEATNFLNVHFADDVVVDYSGQTTFCNQSNLYFDGATLTNCTLSSALSAGANGEIRMVRGVTVDRNVQAVEGWLVLGSFIAQPTSFNYGTRSASGAIIQFNNWTRPSASVASWDIGGAADVTNASCSHNLGEICHNTASTPGLRTSSDSGAGNLTHVIIDNMSVTGYGTAGRFNMFYDEGATPRTHKFCYVRNSIVPNLYTKGDWFVQDGARQGNWWFMYAGIKNCLTQFVNPGVNSVGASEGPAYVANTSVGTSATVRNDPQFVNYQGSTASVGAGGGDYHLQAGSPCIGVVSAAQEIVAFDLDGNPRDRGSIGAYR